MIEELNDILGYLIEPPFIYIGGILLSVLVLWFILRAYARATRPIIPFKAQGGSVQIAPQTLKGIINQTVLSIEGIERAGCKYRSKGSRLVVYVGIHLRSSVRLKEIESVIKGRIRKVLKDQFGIESVDPIHIKLNKVVGDQFVTDSESSEEEEYDLGLEVDPDDDRPYADDLKQS